MKVAAGVLLYRTTDRGLEVLLVHPSGKYNRKSAWSIPKGTLDEGELPEQAARRESWEETGVVPGDLVPIGTVQYVKSRKLIHGFAGPAPADAAPHCASWEVDRAEFLPIKKARKLLHQDQTPFLDRLLELLDGVVEPS